FGGFRRLSIRHPNLRRRTPRAASSLGASGPTPMKSGIRKGSSAKSGITRARDARAMSSAPNHTSRNQPSTRLTEPPKHRVDAYAMVRRRTAEAGLKGKLGCHVFRATGITAYLDAGGSLENAQVMAAHESPRTTKLYDRTGDAITLDEVERINIRDLRKRD